MTNQYSRAERLLTRPFPTKSTKRPPTAPAPTNGHLPSTSKGKGREYDVSQLMLSMPRLPMGPGGLIELPEELHDRVSRLVDMSVACRYLAALCQVGNIPENLNYQLTFFKFRFDWVIGAMRQKCSGNQTPSVEMVCRYSSRAQCCI